MILKHINNDLIQEEVKRLGKWSHNIDLKGVRTAPDHFQGDYPNIKFQKFEHAIPEDLHGKQYLTLVVMQAFIQ